jgi:catechol 2,3-dioxygenase-like lactoylglutathione lyase family enzyme
VNITRLLHVSHHTPQLAEARSFYEDVLCLPRLVRPELPIAGVWLDAGTAQLHLNGRLLLPAECSDSHPSHLCFGVVDMDVARSVLESHGIEHVNAGSLDVDQVWFRDPAGHAIELQKDRP